VIVILTATGVTATPSAQVSYRQVVDRYRVSPDDGVELMLAMPDEARRRGLDEATAGGADRWSWEELAAAAMMHTDAGFYFLTHKQPSLPSLTDAERLIGHAARTAPGHWDHARRWYGMVRSVLKTYGDRDAGEFITRQYTALLIEWLKVRPERIKAGDAYYRGVRNEYEGCQKGEFLTVTGLTDAGDHLIERYFAPAAHELEVALTLDPNLFDASLHLGRVRMLQGREDVAARHFRRAAEAPSRPIQYVAHLFLGSFAEKASQWDAAEAAYRKAIALFPKAQSGTLALAQLLDRRGRVADAERMLITMAAAERAADPWALYFEEVDAADPLRIHLLRAEVLK